VAVSSHDASIRVANAGWAPGLATRGALATLQSQYIHSPTRLHFGPLWRLVYDNRFHRIHHSLEPRHFEKNFGVTTPLWDWMFGTLYVPAKDEWPDTGLADQADMDGIVDFLWRPFHRPKRPEREDQAAAPILAVGEESH